MTEAELRKAAELLQSIKWARERLERAQWVLSKINEHVKSGQVWKPTFRLHDGGRYGNDVNVELPVPGPYLRQWAIDEVRRCQREVVKLGALP